MRTGKFTHLLAYAILMTATGNVLTSCQEKPEDRMDNMSATVEKVTPKQALVSVKIEIPEEILSGRYEAGIVYAKTADFNANNVTTVLLENNGAASFSTDVILKHLECGTEYKVRAFARNALKVENSETTIFTTEKLPAGAIDLGLSNDVLWADRNIGADSPEGNGEVFAFGELTEKETYSAENYSLYSNDPWRPIDIVKYSVPDGKTYESWYENGKFVGDGKYILDPEDDVVTQRLGAGWKTPDLADFKLLLEETDFKFFPRNSKGDKEGGLFTAKNGKSIFLPLAWENYSIAKAENDNVHYRTARLHTAGSLDSDAKAAGSQNAILFTMENSSCRFDAFYREAGFPVRGIYDCSIEERSHEPASEAATVVLHENVFNLTDGVVKPYNDGVFRIELTSALSSSAMDVNLKTHIVIDGLDNLKEGQEIKPTEFLCFYPNVGSNNYRTSCYWGNIYVDSKSNNTVVLRFENVHCRILNEMDIFSNGTIECKIEK